MKIFYLSFYYLQAFLGHFAKKFTKKQKFLPKILVIFIKIPYPPIIFAIGLIFGIYKENFPTNLREILENLSTLSQVFF